MITSQPFQIKTPPDFGGSDNFEPRIKRPYAASGVHFAGSIQGNGPTYLVNNNLQTVNTQSGAFSGGDNGRYSFSFWAQGLVTQPNSGCTLWVSDPGSLPHGVGGGGPVTTGAYTPSLETQGVGGIRVGIGGLNAIYTGPTDNNWHHYLGSFYTNRPAGQKVGAFYIDDILVGPFTFNDSGQGGFMQPVAGKTFYFGDDFVNLGFFPQFPGFGPDVNVADVWIAPGFTLLDIDLTNNKEILANRISPDDRRLFTSILGGSIMIPNDPQTFPPSAILFTGGAGNFSANIGFGGAFTLAGTLSSVTGPSQIPI